MNRKFDEFSKEIKGKRCAVIGIGISNRPLVKWLCSLGAKVTAFDALSEEDPSIIAAKEEFRKAGIGIGWSLGSGYLDRLMNCSFDYVFKTPKMRYDTNPALVAAKEKGAVLTTEMELFLSLCPCRTFGITGSDGKTTTTTLVSEMLKKAGYKVWLGGNIGTPLLDKVGLMSENDMVVLELSSFQLLYNVHAADVAIVTNVTPNHLDFHTDYQEYIDAKKHLFINQDPTGRLVLNAFNDITFDMRKDSKGKTVYFAQDKAVAGKAVADGPRAYIENGMLVYDEKGIRTEIVAEDDIVIPGKHNAENYLAAICAVWPYVTPEDIKAVATSFPGVPHRIEFIREIDGVRYYNSSIDTSPNRTINTMNALSARGMKGVLIAGGKDKKCDYTGLGDAILKVSDRIVIYGDNAGFIRDILAKEAAGRTYEIIELPSDPADVYEFEATRDNVINAYTQALSKARELAKPGEIVIMSSVGTSYDHFRHFEHRGDMFKDLVKAL